MILIRAHVFRQDTGESVRTVPGGRPKAGEDGRLKQLVSTPRVFLGEDVPLRYEIHVTAVSPDRRQSTPAVVTVIAPP